MPCHTQFIIMEKVHPGPAFISIYKGLILTERCKLKLKILNVVPNRLILFKTWQFLNKIETEPFATFEQPFATCGKWQMGWKPLI